MEDPIRWLGLLPLLLMLLFTWLLVNKTRNKEKYKRQKQTIRFARRAAYFPPAGFPRILSHFYILVAFVFAIWFLDNAYNLSSDLPRNLSEISAKSLLAVSLFEICFLGASWYLARIVIAIYDRLFRVSTEARVIDYRWAESFYQTEDETVEINVYFIDTINASGKKRTFAVPHHLRDEIKPVVGDLLRIKYAPYCGYLYKISIAMPGGVEYVSAPRR